MRKGQFVITTKDVNFYGILYRKGNVGEVLEYYPSDFGDDKVRLHMPDGKNIVIYAENVEVLDWMI